MFYTDSDGRTYPAKKRIRNVNGRNVVTWERDVTSANILEVEAGTNGFHGGDTGHGSRTFVRINDAGGTDIRCSVLNDAFGGTQAIEIALGGDTELETFITALKWIISILEVQTETGVVGE